MYEMYQNHTFLIFEFMYLCNPNIQKEEMYDSSYISYIGNFRESVNFKLTISVRISGIYGHVIAPLAINFILDLVP